MPITIGSCPILDEDPSTQNGSFTFPVSHPVASLTAPITQQPGPSSPAIGAYFPSTPPEDSEEPQDEPYLPYLPQNDQNESDDERTLLSAPHPNAPFPDAG